MQIRLTDKYEITKFRLSVVETLRLLKSKYSYKELSRITGLPETVLCRYVRGNIIPSLEQAERIWRSLERYMEIRSLLSERVVVRSEEGFIDMRNVLSDPRILRLVSYSVFARFAGRRVTKVLTPATNGIPLATSIAMVLEVPMIVARKSKENPYEDYYEETVVDSPASVTTYYVPRSALKRRDSVLIVDDFAQTGRTIKALARIVEKARALLSGVVVLLATSDSWAKDLDTQTEVFLKVPMKMLPGR